MAPEGSLPRRKPKENTHIFNLGVKGRKTGLTVPDSGIRDENGLEPMDHLFSSPEKATRRKKINGHSKNANATISSEEDMDVGESTIPDPTEILTERRANMRLPPPRAKTPIKTFLQSPARRNPSLGPNSSPARGSVELRNTSVTASVRRKLDFSSDNLEGNILESSATFGSPRKPGRLAPPMLLHSANDNGNNDQADTEPIEGYTGLDTAGDSFQMGGEADDDVEDEVEDVETEEAFEQDPDPEIEPQSAKQAKGKGKVTEFEVAKPPENRGRGRRPKDTQLIPVEEDTGEPPAKRTRRSLEGPTSAPQVEPKGKPGRPGRPSKHSKPTASKEPKSKALSKKPQLAPIAEAESPEAHRGPPLPRNNRGLMILRRETPMDSSGFKQTRSGRNSIKPLAYWRMERVEYSEDEMEDNHGKFLTSKIKSVVRVDEAEEKQKKKSYYKPSRGKKRSAAVESDDEVEPWETAPGHIFGPTRIWNPDDLTGVEASEHEDEIALSSAAIITRDVAGATFKFAKTLTLPFFGSGMVDLPAGTEKKMKNSRRMQMVFFVFYGRVDVTVNDTTFGIGKGGMWQVPRGNAYGIVNDYDKPARIFFTQACEVLEEAAEEPSEAQ